MNEVTKDQAIENLPNAHYRAKVPFKQWEGTEQYKEYRTANPVARRIFSTYFDVAEDLGIANGYSEQSVNIFALAWAASDKRGSVWLSMLKDDSGFMPSESLPEGMQYKDLYQKLIRATKHNHHPRDLQTMQILSTELNDADVTTIGNMLCAIERDISGALSRWKKHYDTAIDMYENPRSYR